jgi:predicted SnoaL-like aldol condensation-catalyzing enzyme
MNPAKDDLAHNKQIVRQLYETLSGANPMAALRFFADGYSPHVPNHRKLEPLQPGISALQHRLNRAQRIPLSAYRIVADGEYVFAQVLYRAEPAINGVDIFRFDAQRKIAEHWNLRQPLSGEDAVTIAHRFAGLGDPDLPVDLSIVECNRQRAVELYRDVWSKGNAEIALDYYDLDYIQHNPHIQSGGARIRDIIANNIGAYIAAKGTNYPIDIHHMGAQGDVVFVHQEIFMAGLGRNDGDRSSVVDIFRVDAAGKFAEHWDVCQMESDELPDTATLF